MVILADILTSISNYFKFYGKYISDQWRTMTPAAYGTILILIGIFGWLFMKSGTKGPGQ